MRRRSRIKLALFFVALAAFGAFLWGPVRQAMAVAAVQKAVKRNYQIDFGTGERPAMLPDFAAGALRKGLNRVTTGADNIILEERIYGLMRGPVESIEIHFPEGMSVELGDALARFPRLKRFAIEGANHSNEEEWRRLCMGLRNLPRLEVLELEGSALTDAALAPLAGHATLKTLKLGWGTWTAGCVETVATMPNLSQLTILPDELSEKDRDAIRAALPKVHVVFD